MVKEMKEDGPKIDRDAVLEDALQIFSQTDATTAIVTYNSAAVGSVNLSSIINVITRPNIKSDGEKSYR